MSLTPAQLNVIRTWTEQRDALLKEVGELTTERDGLQTSNAEGAASFTDLQNRISEAKGRIAELDALEQRHRTSVATDIAELEARKSRLESECEAKEAALRVLGTRQDDAIHNIEILVLAHDKMSDQAKIVDEVVGQVIETSKTAISDMKIDMAAIHTVATEVIDRGNENVKQTNIVIDGLPKFIFEMQKPIPVRRRYPKGHPYHEDESALTVIKEG